jgi:HlyD family secretion protein
MRRWAPLVAALALAGCGAASDEAVFQGYVEGEFVGMAAEVGGRITELAVRRGASVAAGDVLFHIEDAEARAAVDQARAELARAEAELANLREGSRPPELAVIDAQIAEAEAALEAARRDFERQEALFARNVASAAQLDQSREAITVAEARLRAVERQREVAALPARTPQILAGERAVEAAQAGLSQAATRLSKYSVAAPVAGRIEDVHYEAGEVVAVGSPVLSLLIAGRRKVIFFVPEELRTTLAAGAPVGIACDGCAAGLTGEVTFLGDEAEYTPPIIFSRETRGKLVFRAEATIGGAGVSLPLGQPVDIHHAASLSP